MGEDWLGRWRDNRTGWHEANGNASLRALWSGNVPSGHVLVPLCGKTRDLLWLAEQGATVTGIELSPIAARQFFADEGLAYSRAERGGLPCYHARGLPITLCVGDYFAFESGPFDALYDRGALVALSADRRAHYAAHTSAMLREDAVCLVVTLQYDQQVVDGPPYSISPEEVQSYWPGIARRSERNDIDNCPPKFRDAGLTSVTEVAWLR